VMVSCFWIEVALSLDSNSSSCSAPMRKSAVADTSGTASVVAFAVVPADTEIAAMRKFHLTIVFQNSQTEAEMKVPVVSNPKSTRCMKYEELWCYSRAMF